MSTDRAAYPMVISLPNGVEACVRIVQAMQINEKGGEVLTQIVQTPPQYELFDGTAIDLDVTIPDDLVAAGWFWFGSLLAKGDPAGAHVGTHTSCYPPPGYDAPQGTCFDSARRFEAAAVTHHERRIAEQVAVATKTRRPTYNTPQAAAVQMELF